jgi:hypothetical protein
MAGEGSFAAIMEPESESEEGIKIFHCSETGDVFFDDLSSDSDTPFNTEEANNLTVI